MGQLGLFCRVLGCSVPVNVWWSVCGTCSGANWAKKALKGSRNITSAQQGHILARKSLSCTLPHLPYMFIIMQWNVALCTITNALSDILAMYLTHTQIGVRLSWFTTSPTVDIWSNCNADLKRRPLSFFLLSILLHSCASVRPAHMNVLSLCLIQTRSAVCQQCAAFTHNIKWVK